MSFLESMRMLPPIENAATEANDADLLSSDQKEKATAEATAADEEVTLVAAKNTENPNYIYTQVMRMAREESMRFSFGQNEKVSAEATFVGVKDTEVNNVRHNISTEEQYLAKVRSFQRQHNMERNMTTEAVNFFKDLTTSGYTTNNKQNKEKK